MITKSNVPRGSEILHKGGRKFVVEDEAKEARLAELEFENTRLQFEIEELRKLEREQVNSAHRLQTVYQHVPIAYVTLDERGGIREWNAPAAKLLKADKHQLAKLPLTSFVAREEVRIFLNHLLRCKRAQEGQVVSELHIKSGERFVPMQVLSVPMLSEGKRLFQTALVDLTERKKSEITLRETKEFSDAIIQTIHEPLLVLDCELRILRMNEAFARFFELEQELSKGLFFGSLLNLWWNGNELCSRLESCLEKNVPLNNFEFEVHPRNLGKRTLIFNARPLVRKDRTPALLVALEDITARKDAQARLAESNRELQELNNKLEQRVHERTRELHESNKQLESFCYSIAHDLRGPLRAMAGFGAALQQSFGQKLGALGADYIERIIGAAKQMDELIHDLLEYGRFNTSVMIPTRIDAEDVLNRVLASLESSIQESNATIERKKPLPSIIGHRVALEATLANLLSNALKFVPAKRPPRVTIWPEEHEGQVSIWIQDNGIGIPPQHQAKIFEVFQRLHSPKDYPGTGIGLAIVSKAVQRMGGQVGVSSEPGKGSRFWINLPRAPG
ncbi:MAG TPA: ATP-binding protein [Candidatus Dormibacteraeota bacterium]|nr:ATP-binding protein [Candidatus Dormibacteraeota bacterium]